MLIFSMKTHEISYRKEFIRLISIIIVFLSLIMLGLFWKTMPAILRNVLTCLLLYIPFMFGWSILRLSQIDDNKKHVIVVTKDKFYEILSIFPNSKFLILLNNKYIVYNSSVDLVGDEVTIVRKDNNYISKNDI